MTPDLANRLSLADEYMHPMCKDLVLGSDWNVLSDASIFVEEVTETLEKTAQLLLEINKLSVSSNTTPIALPGEFDEVLESILQAITKAGGNSI